MDCSGSSWSSSLRVMPISSARNNAKGTFLCHTANTGALQEIVGFLFAECCTRNKAIRPEEITCAC